jgi:hypothetical protein
MKIRCSILLGALMTTVPGAFGADRPATEPSPAAGALTAPQLLDRYETAQRRIYGSFVTRLEADSEGYINQHTVLEPGRRKSRDVVEVRSDGRRYFWSEKRYGQCFPRLSETTPPADPRVKWFLFDGRHSYRGGHEPFWMVKQAVQRYAASERPKAFKDRLAVTISDGFDGTSEFAHTFGMGAGAGSKESPDSLGTGGLLAETGLSDKLRKAQSLLVEPKLEPVGGLPCFVLKATLVVAKDERKADFTAEHLYRLHFDPAHDYEIVKMEVTMTRRREPAGEQTVAGPYLVEKRTVENVRLQKVSEAWVPMEWQRSFSVRRLDDPALCQWEKSKVRRTLLQLNPDHEALASFKPAFIQDGWTIQLRGFNNRFDHTGPLAWKQGQIVDSAGQKFNLR